MKQKNTYPYEQNSKYQTKYTFWDEDKVENIQIEALIVLSQKKIVFKLVNHLISEVYP